LLRYFVEYGRYYHIPLVRSNLTELNCDISAYRSYWDRFVIAQIPHPRLRQLADLGVASLNFYVQMHDIPRTISQTTESRCKIGGGWHDIRLFLWPGLAEFIGDEIRVLGAGGVFCLKCER
jgi:hypothetical protein